MSLKKLLIVTPFFAPAWAYGGPPRVLFDLATALVRAGIEVHCATTNALERTATVAVRESRLEGVPTTYFPNLSNFLAWELKFFTPIGMRQFLDNQAPHFDCVHIADFRNLCTLWASRACLRFSIPYVLSPFGSMQNTRDLRGLAKSVMDFAFATTALKKAYRVTVQTQHERDTALGLGVGAERVRLVPLHIDIEKFSSLPKRGAFRSRFRIAPNSKIILFVGRINRHKASDLMIYSFRDALRQRNDLQLVLVGRDDGNEKQLRMLVRELALESKVLFAGPLYYPDSMSAYVDADVFFLAPSHYEETSTASLEALACGCPVVVTKQAEIPNLEALGVGRLVDHAGSCAQALLEILDRPPSREKCIRAARENFSIQKIKDTFLKDVYP
jgi:glycosyltransferase involved in cell wall biosynthesis